MSQADPNKSTNTPSRIAMDFGQAITYLFNNPNWLTNLLLPALLVLPVFCVSCIPILGGFVALVLMSISVGYGWEASACLLATNGSRYPDFDFNRVGVYAGRAVGWLIFNAIVMIIGLVISFAMIGFVITSGPNTVQQGQFRTFQSTTNLIQFAIQYVLPFFMHPMMFRVGLTGNASDTFDFGWGWDYFRRMWLEMIMAALVMLCVSIVATIAGLLMLIVGVALVLPFISLVRGHIDYQLYELYLSRGGVPVMGVAPSTVAGYTPDPSNPYASPAGGGYTPSPMYNPPPGGGSSPPPSWPPPPGKPTE